MQTNQLNKRGEWTLPARSPCGLAAGSWVLACEANRSEEAVALCQPPEAWGCDHLCRGRAGEPPDPEKSPWKGAARTAREVSPWDTGTSLAPRQRKPEKPRAELCVNVRLVASSALGPPCSLGSGQGVSEAGTTPHQPHRQQDRGGRTAGGEGRLAPSPSQGPCCHTHVHTQTRTHRHTCTHMPTDTCTQTHVHADAGACTHRYTHTRAHRHSALT